MSNLDKCLRRAGGNITGEAQSLTYEEYWRKWDDCFTTGCQVAAINVIVHIIDEAIAQQLSYRTVLKRLGMPESAYEACLPLMGLLNVLREALEGKDGS